MFFDTGVYVSGAGMRKVVSLACIGLICLGPTARAQIPSFTQKSTPPRISTRINNAYDNMRFSMSNIGIKAEGVIVEKTYKVFHTFLEQNPSVKPGMTVHLSSPGGSVAGGILLGRYFTEGGFDTFVGTPGLFGTPLTICASACTLAFVGGVKRFVGENARFEIHASRSVKRNGREYSAMEKAFTMEDTARTRYVDALTIRYMRSREIDPLLTACMLEIKPPDIMVVAPFLLKHWRVDNQNPTPLTTKQAELVHESDAHWERPCSVMLNMALVLPPFDAATSN